MAHMFTDDLPPNTALSLSSSLIIRLFFLSCRPFFLMYAHSFLVTSVRGIAFAPTTSASVPLGVTGLMKAAFGLRAVFFFAVFFAMRSPMKTQIASKESTTKRQLFPSGIAHFPYGIPARAPDPLQEPSVTAVTLPQWTLGVHGNVVNWSSRDLAMRFATAPAVTNRP